MNQTNFLAASEQEWQRRGIGFRRADLLEFVADVWPLAQENPDAGFQAQDFVESSRVSRTVWLSRCLGQLIRCPSPQNAWHLSGWPS